MASDVVGPPSFLRFATIAALVSVVVGLGVIGIYTKNTGGGQSASRDIYCWKSGSGNGLCINEMGGMRMSGSLTTQTILVNSGATTTWTRSAPSVSLITSTDKVGVGTATPKAKLTVFGSGAFTKSMSGNTILIQSGGYILGRLMIGKTSNALAPLDVEGTISGSSLQIGGSAAKVNSILTASATLDFANQVALGCENLTISVPGAALSDPVFLGIPNAASSTSGNFTAWVDSAGSVTVKFCAVVVNQDPGSGTFRVDVFQTTP